MLFRSNKN